MKNVIITGSSGLIGSEAVQYYDSKDWQVIGVDNNMRRELFGPKGDTTWNLARLQQATHNFHHVSLDMLRYYLGYLHIAVLMGW